MIPTQTPPVEEQPQVAPIPLGEFPYGWGAIPINVPIQKRCPVSGDLLVDSDGAPSIELDVHGKPIMEQLPFPRYYQKHFTHEPRTVILGSPKRGGYWAGREPKNKRQARRVLQCKPMRFMVWHDRSLRRVDRVLRKQFEKLNLQDQTKLIEQARRAIAGEQ